MTRRARIRRHGWVALTVLAVGLAAGAAATVLGHEMDVESTARQEVTLQAALQGLMLHLGRPPSGSLEHLSAHRVAYVLDADHRVLLASPGASPAPASVRSAATRTLRGQTPQPEPLRPPWEGRPLLAAEVVPGRRSGVEVVVLEDDGNQLRRRMARGWATIAVVVMLVAVGVTVVVHRPQLSLARSAASREQSLERRIGLLERFVGDASHQLRTALTLLLHRLESVEDRAATQPQAVLPAAQAAVHEAESLVGTMEAVLDLSRAGKEQAAPTAVSLDQLLAERLVAWSPVAGHRDIDLVRAGMGHAEGRHRRTSVASALDALLDNAVKYSPRGSLVTVDLQLEPEYAVVGVQNDGPGVPAADLTRAGAAFWSPGEAAPHPGGSGLGLGIVRALMEQHGGRLRLSATTTGSLRAELLVPRSPADEREVPSRRRGPARAGHRRARDARTGGHENTGRGWRRAGGRRTPGTRS